MTLDTAVHDEDGNLTELHCTVDKESANTKPAKGQGKVSELICVVGGVFPYLSVHMPVVDEYIDVRCCMLLW